MADLAVVDNTNSASLARFKEKRDALQVKLSSLDELIQRLEANPELLRVMDLVKLAERNDYD